MAAFRHICTIFLKLGYERLFPSELKIRQWLNTSFSHLLEAEMSVERMILQASGSDKKMCPSSVSMLMQFSANSMKSLCIIKITVRSQLE